ncbi:MAG: extracellular solute-binding protein family 1, partial [Chloroflexi bacterium]|nr:extracellular solute-binding protein family 1 [Chloroflexota bacterium]
GTDPGLSLLLALEAARATAGRGYAVEQAMDALHWALQELHVAYPGDDAPIAVRSSPHGLRGVMLLPPEQLMALAASNAKRTLTPEECRTYLHLAACPDPPSAPDDTRALAVYTASGTVPVERLASASLAGTRVDAVSLLPADMTPLTSTLEDRSGIELAWATGADADLEARVASGDLPDAAIVSRPAVVAKLARAGLLVDMSGFIELERLRSAAGGYLVGLGTVGADGTWPAAEGSLFGAPVVVEASSLVWYPQAAFEQASYRVPRTLDELSALVEQMTSDGHTPWCLGLEDGANSGASAADFVEELVLSTAGPDQYDGWATGNGSFEHIAIAAAFADFRRMVLQDGHVLLGTGAIGSIPRGLAAWPMFLDPPGCWLHLGGGTDRRSWPKGRSDVLAAFPFPAADPGSSGAVRGHAYELVVFRDRPEVRRLIEFLLGGEVASTGTTDLVSAGLWPTGDAAGTAPADPVARAEGGLVREALRAGTFRVDASDLMPPAVAARFERDMLDYVAWGPESLDSVLADIELTRRGASR